MTRRRTIGLGAGLLAVFAGAALLQPGAAAPAARCAGVACLQPALGCLAFLLIYRITGGQWGETLVRPLAAGARLVPWIWPVVGAITLWRAARPGLPLPPDAAPLPGWGALAARAVAYEALLIGLSRVACRPHTRRAAPALIALVLGGHFLAADLFFVLEPGWYSSGFPLVWLSLCSASGLAVSVLASSFDPSQAGSSRRAVGLDWGNLLLAAVVFATYTAFMEFLIIWSGNLPREIAWYHRRAAGSWGAVLVLLAALHLGFPFVFLLFRRVKRSGRGLRRVALLVALAGVVWAVWLILPAFADRGPWLGPLSVAALAAAAWIFSAAFRAAT